MLGYRLLRDADYTDLRDVAATRLVQILAMHETLTTAKIAAATAQARADFVTIRMNVLEIENAAMRQRLTGTTAVAATMETAPVREGLNDSLTTLEDVGDERAAELGARGLLHDTEPWDDLPTGQSLAPGTEGE